MKRNKLRSVDSSASALRWLLWGGAVITLLFWTNAHDPFNAPKSWALSIIAFWLFGWIIFQIKGQWANRTTRVATILSFAFWFTLTLAFLATDNKFVGFFGEYQRKTGYLTYTSFIFLFIAATYLQSHGKLDLLDRVSILLGFSEGAYGLLQHYGKDFVNWNNPYNSVLGSLGNPDFASALMAIFIVLNFGIVIKKDKAIWERCFAIINVVTLFSAVCFSQARQGLLVSVLGISFIILTLVYQKSKINFLILFVFSFCLVIPVFFGILGKGPLSKYFYKNSISLRGDYWRAGLNMFLKSPTFGVGLDRYGANFRTFRDIKQYQRGGATLAANAAHSVPIQLIATGGILVFLAYVSLTSFIAWRALVALKKSKGTFQITTATVVGAWIAYELQSLISIDNIGIAIWGYLLGGTVVGISIIPVATKAKLNNHSNLQVSISSLLSTSLLIVSALFMQSESAMHKLDGLKKPTNQPDVKNYVDFSKTPITGVFKEPYLSLVVAEYLAGIGELDRSIELLKNLTRNDSKFYEAHLLLAQIYEYKKDWINAVASRKIISKIDPLNSINSKYLVSDMASTIN
jgi:O-antigen ligase